jgi:hypothetical protein
MADDLSVRTVLGTYVAKFLAATIVVLALTPFTAPFSTFDAAEIVSEQVLHANALPAKAVQDITDVLTLPPAACGLTPSHTIHSTALAECNDVRPFLVVVLRI